MSIEDRLARIEQRLTKIENAIFKKSADGKQEISSEVETKLIENIDKIAMPDAIVLALKFKPRQTKMQIKTMLEDWGKKVGSWFCGGNMNSRLLKVNLAKQDGTNEENEDLFVLTKKGQLYADKLVREIESGTK